MIQGYTDIAAKKSCACDVALAPFSGFMQIDAVSFMQIDVPTLWSAMSNYP